MFLWEGAARIQLIGAGAAKRSAAPFSAPAHCVPGVDICTCWIDARPERGGQERAACWGGPRPLPLRLLGGHCCTTAAQRTSKSVPLPCALSRLSLLRLSLLPQEAPTAPKSQLDGEVKGRLEAVVQRLVAEGLAGRV